MRITWLHNWVVSIHCCQAPECAVLLRLVQPWRFGADVATGSIAITYDNSATLNGHHPQLVVASRSSDVYHSGRRSVVLGERGGAVSER
jgi:hypothetical protein